MLAMALLAVKGAGASIEETTVSVQTVEVSQNQMLDINTLTGHGLDAKNLPSRLTTIQESALISRNSVLATLEDNGNDATETKTYEVQEGDTLSGIATDFGLTVKTLLAANNIKNADALQPGIELLIPPIDGILYTIKAGDTVGRLANRYQADADKIISFNSLPLTGDVHIGQQIIIPDGVVPKETASKGTRVAVKNISNLRFSGLPKIENYFMTPATCIVTQLAHVRNGYDCANKTGTPIYASAAGIINLVQQSKKGYGNMVRITHGNGTETLYGHLSKIYVQSGQTVTQGQPLGEMGNTGRSSGSHLHFEIHGAYNILAKYGLRGQVIAGK